MPAVAGEYLLTQISPSRVLSFSMFIDPIVELRGILCYDQRIELCFIASVLSNPFWFEHTITSLTRKHLDRGNQFCFGVHPLYDWSEETRSIFGNWQGGPHNRWSPCGGSKPFPTLFGAHADATPEEQRIGQKKLEAVVQVLYHHLQWVNSLSHQSLSDIVHDLPIWKIERQMTLVTETIYKIVPCQFNVFRLQVFTTLVAGCGEMKHGIHLKSLMFPVKGSASFKHLLNPNQDKMTRTEATSLAHQQEQMSKSSTCEEQAGVESKHHDQLMLYLSHELGMGSYLRDETECILCESHPNRNLQCRDWFKKGRRLYDWNIDGKVIQREYGRDTQWTQMKTTTTVKCAFLTDTIIYREMDDILKNHAMAFGETLQNNKGNIKFCGRNTRTSDFIQEYNNEYLSHMSKSFPGIRHRAANFYNGEHIRQTDTTNIQVLGDGEGPAKLASECNDISTYPDGLCLWKYVLYILYGSTSNAHRMYSARYHQHEEESDILSRATVFPGHLDKAFVTSAVFVPLTPRDFFTIVAVPTNWNVEQDHNSYVRMQDWMRSLPMEEVQMVNNFLQQFKVIAGVSMKEEVGVRTFFNSAGTVLKFPANVCYHTTIIPGKTTKLKNPRDLFIIHTTTSTKR